ncbi:MAG TPA: hypothetical protein DCP63_02830 [Bacteroidetes bacterium]|nr:hypothetical protein [Bacteroidota bacterium]
MNVLVTGGSGMVGKYVVDELAAVHEVEVLDIRPLHRQDIRFHSVDLLDFDRTCKAVGRYDAVVHLAGIPHPLDDPAEKVFRTNAVGTFNVLEACALNGVGRFIFMSSESTLGLAFSTTRLWPLYVPIDENHPLRPQDPYGLSKVAGELLCQGYSERLGIQTICLRPPWIWVSEPNELEIYRRLRSEYRQWSKNLWAYIHVSDVARAVRACLESRVIPQHETFFISADDNWTGVESRELLAEFFPETSLIANDFAGMCSLLSSAKAKKVIDFSPRYSWRDLIAGSP